MTTKQTERVMRVVAGAEKMTPASERVDDAVVAVVVQIQMLGTTRSWGQV